MKQFVLPDEPGTDQTEIRLDGRDFHYIVRVRRASVGDHIPVLTPNGRRLVLHIREIGKKNLQADLLPVAAEDHAVDTFRDNPPVRFTLMPAVTKGRRMDLTIRQAVEAGAVSIRPLLTEHCQVRYREESERAAKQKRWERIAVEALQQCGGLVPAAVEAPLELEHVLDSWPDDGLVLFLHERPVEPADGGTKSGNLHRLLAEPVKDVAIIVGPEGGLSPGEVSMLLERGARSVHLGDRILRAETAAVYGLAAAGTIIREKSSWQPA